MLYITFLCGSEWAIVKVHNFDLGARTGRRLKSLAMELADPPAAHPPNASRCSWVQGVGETELDNALDAIVADQMAGALRSSFRKGSMIRTRSARHASLPSSGPSH